MKKYVKIFSFSLLVIAGIIAELFIDSPGGNASNYSEQKELKKSVWVFNGHDLSNLKLVLSNPNADTGSMYKIKDGTIYFNGGFKGYFRTKKEYSDFHLHAEWMWPEKSEKGNSGILVDIQRPDTVWPKCIQINFKEGHAGDLIAMNGAGFKEAAGKPKSTSVIFSKSSEKPEGEWNMCDIQYRGDSMSVYINGKLQNKATKITNVDGTIGWQLEGKPIALRNFYLTK